jgi:hypothetical protein
VQRWTRWRGGDKPIKRGSGNHRQYTWLRGRKQPATTASLRPRGPASPAAALACGIMRSSTQWSPASTWRRRRHSAGWTSAKNQAAQVDAQNGDPGEAIRAAHNCLPQRHQHVKLAAPATMAVPGRPNQADTPTPPEIPASRRLCRATWGCVGGKASRRIGSFASFLGLRMEESRFSFPLIFVR